MPHAPKMPMVYQLESIARLSSRGILGMTVERFVVADVRIKPTIPSPERGFVLDPASDWIPAPGELIRVGEGQAATYLAALPVPRGEFAPMLPLPCQPRIMAKGMGLAVATLADGKVVRRCAIDTTFDEAEYDGYTTIHFQDNQFSKVETAFEKLNDKALAKLGDLEWLEENDPKAIEEADRYVFEITDVTGEVRLLERYLDQVVPSCAAVVLQLQPETCPETRE